MTAQYDAENAWGNGILQQALNDVTRWKNDNAKGRKFLSSFTTLNWNPGDCPYDTLYAPADSKEQYFIYVTKMVSK